MQRHGGAFNIQHSTDTRKGAASLKPGGITGGHGDHERGPRDEDGFFWQANGGHTNERPAADFTNQNPEPEANRETIGKPKAKSQGIYRELSPDGCFNRCANVLPVSSSGSSSPPGRPHGVHPFMAELAPGGPTFKVAGPVHFPGPQRGLDQVVYPSVEVAARCPD
jgi:hypothetical protein